MKLLSSIPAAAKVGGAGVLGGGGIAGTGLLIHDQVQKSKNTKTSLVEDLDAILKAETTATLKVDPDAANFKIGDSKKQVTLTIKASSADTVNGKFKGDKWTCTIKGTVNDVDLTSDNFKEVDQTKKFTDSLSIQTKKQGFIESCKKFRKEEQKTSSGWTSEIVIELKKVTTNSKDTYEFSDTEHVNKIFDGTFPKSS